MLIADGGSRGPFITTFSEWTRLQRRTAAERVRSAARHVAVSTAARRRREISNPRFLRLLYCHYVFDDQRDQFERIVLALKTIGTFVDTATCIEMLNGRLPIHTGCFHLSFDDGFRNILSNAVPILARHKVPAEIFVPTGFVGASYEQTRDYCLNIIHQPGVIEITTWEDLRHAVSLGFGVGSHTRSHLRLSAISDSPTLLREEIHGSKADVEAHLGTRCKHISWTFGGRGDIDGRALELVQSAGYEACFGAFRGQVIPGKTGRFLVPRHHFEPDWPLSHVVFFAGGGMEPSAL